MERQRYTLIKEFSILFSTFRQTIRSTEPKCYIFSTTWNFDHDLSGCSNLDLDDSLDLICGYLLLLAKGQLISE